MAQNVLDGRTSDLVEDTRKRLMAFEQTMRSLLLQLSCIYDGYQLDRDFSQLRQNVEELITRTGH